MPIVGKIFGGLDFSSHFILLGPVPDKYTGSMTDYAALKKAGAPVLGWGQFVTEVVSFLILAFIVFLMVRWATKLMKKPEEAPSGPDARKVATPFGPRLSGQVWVLPCGPWKQATFVIPAGPATLHVHP